MAPVRFLNSKNISLINDNKRKKHSIQGKIFISKCLLVSHYAHIPSILPFYENQIFKAQEEINNYIMDIKHKNKKWISKDKIYGQISMDKSAHK